MLYLKLQSQTEKIKNTEQQLITMAEDVVKAAAHVRNFRCGPCLSTEANNLDMWASLDSV